MHPPRLHPPRLAPGLRVVRRGLHHLQIGLYDGRRLLLPRTESVQRTITLLLEGLATDPDPAVATVLDHLDDHGFLTWERPNEVRRPTVAVLGRLELPGLPDAHDLLAAAGISVVSPTPGADAVIVLSGGELDRERLDPLIRRRTNHVVVRLVDGGAVLGPFVVPGTTPCLRCIDAHQSLLDPDHVAVTTRYVRATGRPRADGAPDLDPALAAIAVAWAVRDVIAHLRGREPSTWSRTLLLAPDPARRHEQVWSRHPRCGCCWSADAPSSGTIGG